MTFLDALRSGRMLLMDGAMGTELMRRGYAGPTWRANLDAPQLVRAIHAEYVAAGAEVVLTNTFLLPYAVGDRREIANVAIDLARASGAAWVLGAIGPANATDVEACAVAFDSVDAILLETWSDPSAFAIAATLKQKLPDLPVLVSFSFAPGEEEKTRELASEAERSEIVALGVNCGREQTPDDLGRTLDVFRSKTTKLLFARPNAGTPQVIDNVWVHPTATTQWAETTAELRDRGAIMLGGCCGTRPAVLGELRRRLNKISPA